MEFLFAPDENKTLPKDLRGIILDYLEPYHWYWDLGVEFLPSHYILTDTHTGYLEIFISDGHSRIVSDLIWYLSSLDSRPLLLSTARNGYVELLDFLSSRTGDALECCWNWMMSVARRSDRSNIVDYLDHYAAESSRKFFRDYRRRFREVAEEKEPHNLPSKAYRRRQRKKKLRDGTS